MSIRNGHRIVIVALVLALARLNVDTAAQSSRAPQRYVPKPADFAVVCTLFNGPSKIGKVELPDIPITYDAHFVIGARVERLEFGKSPWPAGTLVNFVTHSPTLLFGGRFAGDQFRLTLSPFRPTTREDRIWFAPETRYLLQAIERVNPPHGRKGGPDEALHPTHRGRG